MWSDGIPLKPENRQNYYSNWAEQSGSNNKGYRKYITLNCVQALFETTCKWDQSDSDGSFLFVLCKYDSMWEY